MCAVLYVQIWYTYGVAPISRLLQVSLAEYSFFYRSLLQNIVSFVGLFHRALLYVQSIIHSNVDKCSLLHIQMWYKYRVAKTHRMP